MKSTTERIIRDTERFSANNYHPLEIVITSGSGAWLIDVEGNKYLDMFSAYSAQNFGQCHPRIIAAMVDQARRLGTTSRAIYTDIYTRFCLAVNELTSFDKVLPANGGAEAVETAIKISRKWGYVRKRIPGEAEIIVCKNNFHGRTTTIVGFSDTEQNRNGFGPFVSGAFKAVEFGNVAEFEKAITKNTVAFLVEPIQGEGGIIIPPEGYFKEIETICRKNNILLVMDEIQTGFGRTGSDFAFQYENVLPDILILGKALGGGVLPSSAVLAWKDVMSVIEPGDHGSTFGGNPIACAVGIAAIDLLMGDRLSLEAANLGDYFMSRLRDINNPRIKEIRGRGLLIGLELNGNRGIGRRFCEDALKQGLVCKETKDNVIRLSPPLIITGEEIDWAVERIEKVLKGF